MNPPLVKLFSDGIPNLATSIVGVVDDNLAVPLLEELPYSIFAHLSNFCPQLLSFLALLAFLFDTRPQ